MHSPHIVYPNKFNILKLELFLLFKPLRRASTFKTRPQSYLSFLFLVAAIFQIIISVDTSIITNHRFSSLIRVEIVTPEKTKEKEPPL